MKVREIIKRIEEDGWGVVSQEGSHRQFKHATKKVALRYRAIAAMICIPS